MSIQEIRIQDLKAETFIEEQCRLISAEVGNSKAINALSGDADSPVTTMPAHRAPGTRLIPYFIDNGLANSVRDLLSDRMPSRQAPRSCWRQAIIAPKSPGVIGLEV